MTGSDRYLILEEIGRGHSAVVSRAKDTVLGQEVAIKVFNEDADIPKWEIILGQTIRHSNVVQIRGYELLNGRHCIIMEYVSGNLRAGLRSGPMPLTEVMRIIGQVCDGVEAAHVEGIVHRDLKPENILIDEEGQVKVADFGHARRPIDSGTETQSNISGIPGTLYYAAPEQLAGRKTDERVDIYSIGVMMYELLSGTPDVKQLSSLPLEAPANVEAALHQCLEIDPARRPRSIADLRRLLLQGEPVIIRSAPKLTAPLVAACLVLLIAGSVLVWKWPAMGTTPSRLGGAGVKPAATSRPVMSASPLDQGTYYLDNDLATEALAKFDEVLASDPGNTKALFLRGIALEKLDRRKEAEAAFMRALPGTVSEQRIPWSWQAPSAPGSAHGFLVAVDTASGPVPRPKRLIYAVRKAKSAVLYVLNLERRTSRRLELDEDALLFSPNLTVAANEHFTLVLGTAGATTGGLPAKYRVHAVSADGRPLWHTEIEDFGPTAPVIRATSTDCYVYMPARHRLIVLDGRTGLPRWTPREDVLIDPGSSPVALGDALIVKVNNAYRSIRLEDGTESVTNPDTAAFLDAAKLKAPEELHFKGAVIHRVSPNDLEFVDAETSKTLWEYSGANVGSLIAGSALFVFDENGVREVNVEKASEEVKSKEVLTEAASVLVTDGELDRADFLVNKIAKEIDPNYPPLRLLRARLLIAKAKAANRKPPPQAPSELAAYAAFVGPHSDDAKPVLETLKRDFGVALTGNLESSVLGRPVLIDGRLVNLAQGQGNAGIVALDMTTGERAWRQDAERVVDSVAGSERGRPFVWFVGGNSRDATEVSLHRIDVRNGEAQPLGEPWKRRGPVSEVHLAYMPGRVFVVSAAKDLAAGWVDVGIDAFDATSGQRLWPAKIYSQNASGIEVRHPLGLFVIQSNRLIYSVTHDIFAVDVHDGTVVDQQRDDLIIGDDELHEPVASGPLYYMNGAGRQIVTYDVAKKQITRTGRPEADSAEPLVRNGVMFATNNGPLYAFDIASGKMKWQTPPSDLKFRSVSDGDKNLWALRDDNVLVAVDRETGRAMRTVATLWSPSTYIVRNDLFYAFSKAGLAYALKLK